MVKRKVIISRKEKLISATTTTMTTMYDFSQIYGNIYSRLENCPSGWTHRFTWWLMSKVGGLPASQITFGSLALRNFVKERSQKQIDVPSPRTMSAVIEELLKVGIIKKAMTGKDIYEVNLEIFGEIENQENDTEGEQGVEAATLREADS